MYIHATRSYVLFFVLTHPHWRGRRGHSVSDCSQLFAGPRESAPCRRSGSGAAERQRPERCRGSGIKESVEVHRGVVSPDRSWCGAHRASVRREAVASTQRPENENEGGRKGRGPCLSFENREDAGLHLGVTVRHQRQLHPLGREGGGARRTIRAPRRRLRTAPVFVYLIPLSLPVRRAEFARRREMPLAASSLRRGITTRVHVSHGCSHCRDPTRRCLVSHVARFVKLPRRLHRDAVRKRSPDVPRDVNATYCDDAVCTLFALLLLDGGSLPCHFVHVRDR